MKNFGRPLFINCKGDLLQVFNVTFFRRIYSCYNHSTGKFENYKEFEVACYSFDDCEIHEGLKI